MNLIVTTEEDLFALIKRGINEANAHTNSNSVQPGKPATKQDVMKYLGISLSTLDTLIKTNQIKFFNIGTNVRFRWIDIDDFINKKISK